MKNIISMYIVTHKAFEPPEKKLYLPIQVGKQTTHIDLGFVSDDVGENIAWKNYCYCELTALYWIWKNDYNSKYVGLCHYRRYFTSNPFSKRSKFFLGEKKIVKYLKKADVILPSKIHLKNTVEEKYSLTGAGFQHDLDFVRRIINSDYPQYLDTYDIVMNESCQYFWNMFVLSKELLDEYCEWLFDILLKLENVTNIENYNVRQKRIYGYISERLLNVWVRYNNLKIVECPVVQTDQKWFKIIKTGIGTIFKHKKN